MTEGTRRTRRVSGSMMASPHATWTLLCVAFLCFGGLLETFLAQEHQVRVEDLSRHPGASLVKPGLMLAGAVISGAWPAFLATWRVIRRGRFTWQMLIAVTVIAAFGSGHLFEAGGVALVFSVGQMLMARRTTEP